MNAYIYMRRDQSKASVQITPFQLHSPNVGSQADCSTISCKSAICRIRTTSPFIGPIVPYALLCSLPPE